ncbi:hypothetical protein BT63DRAFT_410310 [Microthyrium microscopicum]|uniref:Uncharacterized protein n=1 Tax=Microthyrium microscopicum TaxID=703497 RepID=A0A6A6ULX3_9PEZI|nr:hypothetical protein BT63DRAFT_410310 [Microthyrium microscopicum]
MAQNKRPGQQRQKGGMTEEEKEREQARVARLTQKHQQIIDARQRGDRARTLFDQLLEDVDKFRPLRQAKQNQQAKQAPKLSQLQEQIQQTIEQAQLKGEVIPSANFVYRLSTIETLPRFMEAYECKTLDDAKEILAAMRVEEENNDEVEAQDELERRRRQEG